MKFKKRLKYHFYIVLFILCLLPSKVIHANSNNRIRNLKSLLNFDSEFESYMFDKGLATWTAFLILILLILMCILLINISRRIAAENIAKQAQERLQESFIELEAAYQEVTKTQNQLKSKYEEIKRSEEKNKKLAYTDYLTELPNRTAFTEKLDQVMLTLRKAEVVGIMYIDLDNFKNINDSIGHSYGDELLIDVTHRLKQAIGEDDYLARFGGDEFIILSQNVSELSEFEEKIKKIQKVFSYPFVLALKEFFVTISIGISFAPKDGKVTQTIIKNVDSAMYCAKEMGKNTHCYFDETINRKLMEKIELQSELRKAIENEEFKVYYQAQINLNTDRIVGFEALVRWYHPTKGIIPPIDFINLAEETGLIVPIGRRVLLDACKQLKEWSLKGYEDIKIAVNLSARQFKDSNLIQMVHDIIDETGINPKRLELEITETIVLDNVEFSIMTIEKLKEIGVQFSLDDFGTGYSSMNYLKVLPVDNLKIDKSFLDTITENQNEQKIVQAIVTLAQTLGLVVVAEGVESSEQANFLKGINCDKAQGYLYSRPIPKAEATVLLDQWFVEFT